MPSSARTRILVTFLAALVVTAAFGCQDKGKAQQKAPSRFAAVTRESGEKAQRVFCEQTFPRSGEGARAFVRPKERPAPPHEHPSSKEGGWRWVNLWATWCRPCVEEMPLLARWRDALTKDGLPLSVELWSVDEDEDALTDWLKKNRMPGEVRWLESSDALAATLASFGLDASSPIPVHVLVDPDGQVRCARVGAVHEEDYGAVKAMLSSR